MSQCEHTRVSASGLLTHCVFLADSHNIFNKMLKRVLYASLSLCDLCERLKFELPTFHSLLFQQHYREAVLLNYSNFADGATVGRLNSTGYFHQRHSHTAEPTEGLRVVSYNLLADYNLRQEIGRGGDVYWCVCLSVSHDVCVPSLCLRVGVTLCVRVTVWCVGLLCMCRLAYISQRVSCCLCVCRHVCVTISLPRAGDHSKIGQWKLPSNTGDRSCCRKWPATTQICSCCRSALSLLSCSLLSRCSLALCSLAALSRSALCPFCHPTLAPCSLCQPVSPLSCSLLSPSLLSALCATLLSRSLLSIVCFSHRLFIICCCPSTRTFAAPL